MENMMKNIVTLCDSYKMTHWNQYPEGTEYVYSYFEARPGAKFPTTTFFGLQYLIKNWLEGVVVTTEKIDRAEKLAARHFGNPNIFKRERWDYIVEKHGGRLPVKIKAVPEGTVVPINNIMMSVENTDPKCYWLTNHLETLLCQVWAPSTIATLSRSVKDRFKSWLNLTCDDGENFAGLPFMLHDFGKRGVSSMESAGAGGAGHLINFLGTDTVIAMEYIEYYYGGIETGYSVPATEHSVMTSRGRAGEKEVIAQLLKNHPTGILSVVSDSYDIYHCVEHYYGEVFKDEILARDGKFVVRPDSGDPVEVVTTLLNIMWDKFGGTINNKGFKVLNPKVGLIWGDGIDAAGIEKVLEATFNIGFSVENLVFGMGGGLLQKINRDTQRFAFKSSAQRRNGEWFEIFKDPIDGSKSSKKGMLKLCKDKNEHYLTVQTNDVQYCRKLDYLETIFEDGKLFKDYDFNQVIKNSNK
jgi:nicotinamide phosphoribosyltransferase